VLLVLTRRANQSIMIGENVVVTVLEVRGDQVRLGIVAPREIEVHREEVFRALHGEPTPPREIDVTDDAPETTGARRRRRDH
jgi:carbon storage regulator